jgi:site-specific recombinase XerD
MRQLLLAPDATTRSGLRDRTILEVLYGTGLRFSELADLTVTDVDLVEQVLWVRCGKGTKDRVLPLGRWATHWLGRYMTATDRLRRQRGTERVFLAPRAERLSDHMVNAWVKDLAAQAGLTKPVTAHTLRHTFATVLLKGGADVRKIQRLLGHELLTTTEVYTHLDLEDLRRVQENCHPREKRRGAVRRATLPEE